MIGLLSFTALFGAGLWYSMNYAYYQSTDNVTEIAAFGQILPVSEYQSIDADTSPLKIRACFKTDWDMAAFEGYQSDAEPLIAPKWFKCFNAAQITEDISAGKAVVLRAQENQPFGFDRFIASYPDGRAFMWRTINPCGNAKFTGEKMPYNCDARGEPKAQISTPEPATVVATVTPTHQPDPALREWASVIRLVPLIGDGPEEIATGVVKTIGDTTMPLSFHGCFNMVQSFGLLTETFETAEPTTPQRIPGGLACFDAEQLAEDLQIGNAIAFWGERNITQGVDRVVAVYDDGRAFVWHQSNENNAE